MQFMKNKKNKLLWGILYVLLLPFWILRGISLLIGHFFRGIHFSMRKRIGFNYMVLYSIVAVCTFLFMVMGFTVFEINEKNDDITLTVNNLMRKYVDERLNLEELELEISSVAELNNCGIQLYFSESKDVVRSERFKNYNYPDNFLENAYVLIADSLYSDQKELNYLNEDIQGNEVVKINILQPIKLFYRQMTTLSKMLLSCLLLGFGFIWFFGSVINRRNFIPIYEMTKTAEKISIRNMSQELDVSQAKYELKDLAMTLNSMLARLRTDYEKQKRFVSDVSHELRTPISIINGYSNMLKRWGKQDEAILDESIEAIVGEVKSMQLLVENLLTLVRADNQTLKFNEDTFIIAELLDDVFEETKMINQKNQKILYQCECLQEVVLDYQKTKQMLRIFVDNAVKYTPEEGVIEIYCHLEQDECVFTIKDSGIGIDNKDLPYIFDRFYRSDESRTRETGGHGLGLSIAKAIVIGQGGRIKVKSKKNEGSEFTVNLPINNKQ